MTARRGEEQEGWSEEARPEVQAPATRTWSNWCENVVHSDVPVYSPSSLEELKACIRDATERNLKVRAVGSGHSWRHLDIPADQPTAILLTDGLGRVLDVRPEEDLIVVEGGIKLHELNRVLFEEHGLALPNLGDIDRQSIAGVISTDTHGSGASLVSFPELVEGMTLVTSDGSEYQLEGRELEVGRASLGQLGVMYSVTLKVTKAFFLEERKKVVKVRGQKEHLERLLEENRNIEYWFYPYTGRADRVIRREIEPVELRRQGLAKHLTAVATRVFSWLSKTAPRALPFAFNALARLPTPRIKRGPSHWVLPSVAQAAVDIHNSYCMEYLFPLEKFWDAFDELEESIRVAREKGVYISLPVHLRFVKASQRTLLSPIVFEPVTASFSVNFGTGYSDVDTWFKDFEERMRALGGKPHLGKMSYHPTVFPPEFEDLSRKIDPSGMFRTAPRPA